MGCAGCAPVVLVRCGTSQCDIVSVVYCGIVGAVRCGAVRSSVAAFSARNRNTGEKYGASYNNDENKL